MVTTKFTFRMRLIGILVAVVALAILVWGIMQLTGRGWPTDLAKESAIKEAGELGSQRLAAGDVDGAMLLLGAAAEDGDEKALAMVQEEAGKGSEAAMIALGQIYARAGKVEEGMEWYYRAAKAKPEMHAMSVGLFYLFGSEADFGKKPTDYVDRAIECLRLASESRKAVYVLLCLLCEDGVLLPAPATRAKWAKASEAVTPKEIDVLCVHLASFSQEKVCLYARELARIRKKRQRDVTDLGKPANEGTRPNP